MVETLDRSALWAVQTPQAFRRSGARARARRRRGHARRGHRRRLARRALRRDGAASCPPRARTSRSRRRSTCRRRARCWPRALSGRRCDADRLPRAPAPGRARHAARGATSPPPTPSATARRPPSAASTSSASPSTSTASTRRSTSGQHPFWRRWAVDDLDEYCALRARGDRPAAGHRGRLRPRPRGPHGQPARGARVGLRDRVGPLPARPRGGHGRRVGRVERRAQRRRRVARATSRRWARPRPAACSTSSRTPTWSRSGARAARARTATCAASTTWRWRGSPSRGSRSRSRPPACASAAGEIYPDRVLLEWCVDAGCPIALSSDAHVPEDVGHALRAGARAARRPSA